MLGLEIVIYIMWACALLEMRHNHVFELRICKFNNKCHLRHSLVAPRVFISCGKIFKKILRALKIVSHIM